MDNQQATPTDAEIAWLAGIVEGEGTLTMSPHHTGREKSDKYLKIAVTIQIYNTDAGIMAKVAEILDGMGIGYHLMERQQKPLQMEGRPQYLTRDSLLTIKVKQMRGALAFLLRLRPWFFGDKAKRADLMVKYLKRRVAVLEGAGFNGTQGGFRPPLDVVDWRTMKEFLALGGRSTKHDLVERVLNEHELRAREIA